MPVPDFQSMMLPLLELTADNQPHSVSEAYEVLAHRLGLAAGDLEEMLPSGRQSRFKNRVQWAKTHLSKAGCIRMAGPAVFEITTRGEQLLAEGPERVTIALLRRYPEFREFRARKPSDAPDGALQQTADDEQTPQEVLEASYQSLRHALADELLARIMSSPPEFFERLVVDLLVAMGYGGSRLDAGASLGKSHDSGVDGVIKEDRLGLDAVYIQAKRWQNNVGRPELQAFAGSLMGLKARKGVFITTSAFTSEAAEYVKSVQERNIVLVDGETLAELMMDHDVGVSEVSRFIIKQLDSDYFDEA